MGVYHQRLMEEFCVAGLAEASQRTYLHQCISFFNHYKGIPANKIEESQVREWLMLLRQRELSDSTINVAKNALLFFFTKVLDRPLWKIFREFKIEQPRKCTVILSRNEVWRILNQVYLYQYRTPIYMLYVCGLRINECINLQVRDIHKDEKRIHIREGKGKIDRYVPIADKALDNLRRHWSRHKNPKYLFPRNNRPEETILADTLRKALKSAVVKAKIRKEDVVPHTLRHSYATHLLEMGVPIEHLREFLGHKDVNTTQRYTHITPNGYAHTQIQINSLVDDEYEC
ncbi:MAG: site-specific integrase [Planctomycetes bacterium]|nr:site-specific integrase [Planctomycetota bacterium]